MAAYELTCLDCGETGHRVKRSDAKYCPRCKLRRALTFVETGRHAMRATRKCRTCRVEYRMTHAKDLKTCGGCDTAELSTSERATLPSCSWCGGPVHSRSALPSVCLGCQSDPKRRKKLRLGLKHGFADRVAVNKSTLAGLAAGAPHLRRL